VTRLYGPRPRVGCYPGCIGCSIPLLAVVIAIAAVVAAVLLAL
jgi:hypothetical protein